MKKGDIIVGFYSCGERKASHKVREWFYYPLIQAIIPVFRTFRGVWGEVVTSPRFAYLFRNVSLHETYKVGRRRQLTLPEQQNKQNRAPQL